MTPLVHEFATRSVLVRRALAAHEAWIEERLGVPFSEVIIFDGLKNLSQVGVQKYLGVYDRRRADNRQAQRLKPLVANAEAPPQHPPIVSLTHDVPADLSLEVLLEDRATPWTGLKWDECPLALRLHLYDCTVVVLNIAYLSGADSQRESNARVLVARRDSTAKVVRLLEDLYQRDHTPQLVTVNGEAQRISRVEWSDLVIDADVISLLKNDFETFWKREPWFREHNLPFRRGYLLHGPPGNGKTSAIRAMASSRSLNAHTLRFFDERTDDSDLDELFARAHRDRPSIVLLEDIDRAFPRTGESKSKVSLQHLLNCLDGVATVDGVVVVATANKPSILDRAILRRPGRFDRVVAFLNPTAELRRDYFRLLNSGVDPDLLQQPVEESEGFSFAQLRESYIIAGQFAFERGDAVGEEDLLAGIRALQKGNVPSSRHGGAAGFRSHDEGAA